MEEVKIQEAANEIKNASTEELENVVTSWFEKTRTDGMKLGAKFISAAIFGAIQKHIKKKAKPSLRDYQRCIEEIIKIVAVQLAEQDDSEETVEENEDDRTTE